MKLFNHQRILTAILLVVAAITAQATITYSVSVLSYNNETKVREFNIKRNGTSSELATTTTVRYRTVSQSALANQHFREKYGNATFSSSSNSVTISVDETPATDYAKYYYYQDTEYRNYRFEVIDEDESNILASCEAQITYPGNAISIGVNKSITDLVYFNNGDYASGVNSDKYYDVHSNYSITVDDSYDYINYTSFLVKNFYDNMNNLNRDYTTGNYMSNIGNKLYATLCFTEREVNDGYQYIQILADNETTYDGKDPDGKVDTPSKSVYKACFELSKSTTAMTTNYKQFFPHRYDYHNRTEGSQTASHTEFNYENGYLWEQEFKSNDYRASQTGAIVLNPKTQTLTVRFDANGSGDDTWVASNFFVRFALYDNVTPTLLDYLKVNSGYHYRDNPVTISMPFTEIVYVSGTPTLNTSWGTLTYEAGSGSNVLSFTGIITANPGTQFIATGINGTIADMAGNNFVWPGDMQATWTVGYRNNIDDFERDSEGRYLINTITDLNSLATLVNAGTQTTGKVFLQTADIVAGSNYQPVGTRDNPFRGTYDGGGHAISGINIAETGTDDASCYKGVFGFIRSIKSGNTTYVATVKNLILRNSTIMGYAYLGGIAGKNMGGTVENCRVENTVTIKAGHDEASGLGGIVGETNTGTGNTPTSIKGCLSAASVTNSGKQDCERFGGIVGSHIAGTVSSSMYTGNTVVADTCVGTIVGKYGGKLSNNYYLDSSLPGGADGKDVNNAQLAHIITLASTVHLTSPALNTTYDVSQLTDIRNSAILYNNTYYSGNGKKITLVYNGSTPDDYSPVYYVNGARVDGTSFTMPDEDVYVTASLRPLFNINLPEETPHGTVRSDLARATEGKIVTITVTPDNGYSIASFTVMAGETPIEISDEIHSSYGFTKYTFYMPPADVTVSATFEPTVVPGDANGDGIVNINDITVVVAKVAGNNPQPFVEAAADLDGDGIIGVADITALVRLVMSE